MLARLRVALTAALAAAALWGPPCGADAVVVGAAAVLLAVAATNTGGLAADEGLLQAMREAVETQKARARVEIRAHPQSALAGAYGAALWGAFRARKLAREGVAFAPGATA